MSIKKKRIVHRTFAAYLYFDVLTGYSVPLPKHQSGFGLCFIVAGGRAADEHGRATVPSQGVLQDARHFAVPVWHVTLLPKERKEKRIRKEEDKNQSFGLVLQQVIEKIKFI